MSVAILFHFLCTQHVSDINIYIVPVLQAETQASACNTDTTQTQPHQISSTQRTENKTTYVVIQQHSRKLLTMGILMSETCWVHTKWNKITSDIKLVFYSSTITIIYGPINIRLEQQHMFVILFLPWKHVSVYWPSSSYPYKTSEREYLLQEHNTTHDLFRVL